MQQIELSVRGLVSFVLKSGSIDQRYQGASRMLEGSKLHRKIQKRDQSLRKDYQTEVHLTGIIEYERYTFSLTGRADAVYNEDEMVVIEEIKSVTQDPSNLKAQPVHWAQLMVYGYLYLIKHPDTNIRLRLSYYQLDSDAYRYFEEKADLESLKEKTYSLIRDYIRWAELLTDWTAQRDQSLNTLPFVFEQYRKGQREMSLAIYNSLKREQNLFLQAPTGIGKTISSLFASLKKMPDSYDQIFYLTAKTQTQKEAQKALEKLRQTGAQIRSVLISAKDKVCLSGQEERQCTPESCPYAQDYYDKINPILFQLLQEKTDFTREGIEEIAKKETVCPFELSLDLAKFSDVIICDYNYIFDPGGLLADEEKQGQSVLLIDEAHNLPERARDMYSIRLNDQLFCEYQELIDKHPKTRGVLNALLDVLNQFDLLSLLSGTKEVIFERFFPTAFIESIEKLSFAINRYLKKLDGEDPFQLAKLSLELRKFLTISDYFDESFRTSINTENGIEIGLICMDASKMIRSRIGLCGKAVLYSATLTPFSYYKEICGYDSETPHLALPSPFNAENLLMLHDKRISTKYKDRESSVLSITEDLESFTQAKEGNYMVFFPSYEYMDQVYDSFQYYRTEKTVLLKQKNSMNQEERETFLKEFLPESGKTKIAFCVMGGSFSEGLDLPGEKLIGAVIISPALPGLSTFQDELKDFYQEQNQKGFSYAYQIPGMNKVLQAIGRVIRSDEDKGMILLVDPRFSSNSYYTLFPDHLKPFRSVYQPAQIAKLAESFWNQDKVQG